MLQHHICINRQLCEKLCGCVEGVYCHFNITTASTVNYVRSCVGVWRVYTVTLISQLHQLSTLWGGVWACGGCILSLQYHNCTVNYVGLNWGCMGVWRVNTVTSTSQLH